MNWYETFSKWVMGFLSDSKTGKASLTALLKLGLMIVLWTPYVRLSFAEMKFPVVEDWQAYITILILFEKFAGRLIDAMLFAKLGIKPDQGKAE